VMVGVAFDLEDQPVTDAVASVPGVHPSRALDGNIRE
jgi:hypothetical protein